MANYSDNSSLYNSIQDLSNKSDDQNSVLKIIWNKLGSINTDGNRVIQNQINQIQNTISSINQAHPSKMHIYNGGSVDLNALSKQGVYSFTGTALRNAPSNTVGNQFTGYMTIDSSTGNPNDGTPDRIQRLVLDFSGAGNACNIYLRHWSGGHWFSWNKLADDSETSNLQSQISNLQNVINQSNQHILQHKGEIPNNDMNNITTDGIYDIKGEWLNNGPGDARDSGNYYGTLKVVHDDYGQIWQFMYTDWGNPADQNSSGSDGDGAIAYRCMNQGWNVLVTQAQANKLQNQINSINGQLHFSHEVGPESGDFNNFTQTGYYAIWDGGLQNAPIQHNGSLLVFDQPNTETLLQIFFDGSDNRAWMRQRGLLGDNTDWNAWRELGTNAIQPLPSWVSDLNHVPDGRWYLPDNDIGDYDTIISQQTYNNNQTIIQSIVYYKDGIRIIRSYENGKWNDYHQIYDISHLK